jgi:predicted amidohydrolase YtcJ
MRQILKPLSVAMSLLASACASAPEMGQSVDLMIRNARVVDVATGQVTPGQTVAVRGDTIVAVESDASAARRFTAAQSLDAQGRWVMPGLWDNHVHFGGAGLEDENADLMPLYVLNGVTAVRDAVTPFST